ncbi:MAG: glycosyltransferase [Nanoarchaeota archaeon]|nr:glycosyltransferase [Nanoarchaeota archaeon]
MRPEISFVIPTFNEEAYIEKTLISLKNQKTKIPYEIIISDCKSSDRTLEIAKKYADKIVSVEKRGIGVGRNAGIKQSSAEYIVNTDADTIFPEDFVEKVYPLFKSKEYVGFYCGKWDYYTGKSLILKLLTLLASTLLVLYSKIQSVKNTTTLPGWCLCTQRWVFDAVGGFDEDTSKCEDVNYSYAIEVLGKKYYYSHINVRSSVRRFEKSLPESYVHYKTLGHGPLNWWRDLARESRNPYLGVLGFRIKKRFIIATLFLLTITIRLIF